VTQEEETMSEEESGQGETGLEFGSNRCVCPRCGTEVPHALRGVPCSRTKCPKCGSQMKGTQCGE
jgi:hypothetical protein